MRAIRALTMAAALVGLLPASASATWWWYKSPACTPDSVGSGSVQITDPIGTFWTFQVAYEVFADDNCANPRPVSGSFTYVYTVTFADQGPLPITLNEMRVQIQDASYVTEAGAITGGPGDAPLSVEIVSGPNSSVTATFDPGTFLLGDSSLPIYAVSPYQPGNGTVNLQANLFAGAGVVLVPKELPEACPCTASFWQYRALGLLWFYFPGSQWNSIKARAVQLSQGYFDDEGDLLSALFYAGFLNVKRKAERELATVLLNVAAGELFPGNTRCRLFAGSQLDVDGDDVADLTVGEAIGQIITNIESGNWSLQYDAFVLGYDINDGGIVLGATHFQ